jgi:hypothetical protein
LSVRSDDTVASSSFSCVPRRLILCVAQSIPVVTPKNKDQKEFEEHLEESKGAKEADWVYKVDEK